MDERNWFLFVGPLLGVVIGGLITSGAKWLELRHQNRVKIRDIMLARIEELHDLLIRYPILVTETMQRMVESEEGNSLRKIGAKALMIPVSRVDGLVDIYFPELRRDFDHILELEEQLCNEYLRALARHSREKATKVESKADLYFMVDTKSDFAVKFREFEAATDKMARDASKAIRKYI